MAILLASLVIVLTSLFIAFVIKMPFLALGWCVAILINFLTGNPASVLLVYVGLLTDIHRVRASLFREAIEKNNFGS
ncbi:MAG: hypothetical protein UT41_C0003G0098 [Candidatus Wolfebacteria bacterium GW2011_GWC2_39_22]|uniref:Uncharacterized protein n=1 Tax=Candidatus Wolfebacteria bacterium GW2011_GWC2_39_22 TaxID=1619013 RepID=A0A0G0NHA2_9BACT|nr:MAG: hypothetical protein UT41_C0003G0098 [Candidatus Wolfebacteria bacterium GW2011_GWC2_39_22]